MAGVDSKDLGDSGLSSSLEDYLEAIYHLERENRVARAKDIADRLEVSRASVTTALKALASRDLINYQPYSYITLTQAGKAAAAEVARRHAALKEFFQYFLQLDPDHSDANACRVEHVLDDKAMERLVAFLNFMKACPRTGADWIDSFENFCHGMANKERCDQCLDKCLRRYRS